MVYEWSSPDRLHLSDVGGLGISISDCGRLKWFDVSGERVVMREGLLTVDAENWTACIAKGS